MLIKMVNIGMVVFYNMVFFGLDHQEKKGKWYIGILKSRKNKGLIFYIGGKG